MDKVRAFMQVLWVQRFWVLSVVGVLAAAVCWMMAAGKLQAEYAADKTAILGKFGEMDKIKQASFHGNEGVNAKEREEAAKIAENVKGLWHELYENQREKVLFWPESLGREFVEYIDKRKFDQNISPVMRDRYLNYISTRFDALVDIVKAQKLAPGATGGAFGGEGRGFERGGMAQAAMPGQPGYVEDYLVQWLDQDALRTKLTFGRTPSPREVWVRQEDLWVYEILLKVIAATNKERGAKRPDNTAIRVIENLQVGAEAALANAVQPQILMPAGTAADPSMGGMEGGEGGAYAGRGMEGGGEGMYRGEGGMGGVDPAQADAALLADRYVDAEGKPMADLSAGAGVEYRRLPVRMRLQMDQRWIPKVLVECANAALPIEVQRLRINPDKSGAGFDAMAGGGGEGGMYRGGGGMYRGGEGGMSSYATPGAVPADFVTVEIQGLVYIYNPPDASVLAVPGGEEDLAAAPAEEVAVVQ
jgi:hypothetical protein